VFSQLSWGLEWSLCRKVGFAKTHLHLEPTADFYPEVSKGPGLSGGSGANCEPSSDRVVAGANCEWVRD